MKKQFAAVFAATAVLGVTTAFANNPFSDVSSEHYSFRNGANDCKSYGEPRSS